jgi:hypothetical protein
MEFGWLPKAIFILLVLVVLFSIWYGKRNPPPPEAR